MPSKFKEPNKACVIEAFRVGHSTAAAAYAGKIHRQTLWRWLSKGEKAKSGAYRDFYNAVEKAKGRPVKLAEEVLVETFTNTGNPAALRFKAALTFLERRTDAWTPKRSVESAITVESEVKVEEMRTFTHEERREAIAQSVKEAMLENGVKTDGESE